MKTISWTIAVVALGLVIALLCLNGCRDEKPFQKPLIPVRLKPVQEVHVEEGTKYSATLAPRQQVEVAFKVGGYVQEILEFTAPDGKMRDVQKGDAVTKGTVLASLRDTDYQAKLGQAMSALEETKASLSQSIRDYDRSERLFQADALSKNDFEKTKEKMEVAKARVSGAESQVQEAQIQLQDTLLKCPLDSVVVNRAVERGSLVAPGTRAYVLADLTSVKALFGVPDHILKQIKTGDTLTVTVETLQDKEFKGAVTAISPSADPKSRVFEVEITIANPDFHLRDGMVATVRTAGMAVERSIPVVPLSAVVRPPGESQGYMVFLVEDGDGRKLARGHRVKIGQIFGNSVAIIEGLSSRDSVVTTGASLLSEGVAVSIIP